MIVKVWHSKLPSTKQSNIFDLSNKNYVSSLSFRLLVQNKHLTLSLHFFIIVVFLNPQSNGDFFSTKIE